ncbi:hypothetical protein Tco_0878967 [Tanacetum coccineum]
MSTQQDIYAAGSENRPPMLNKENYVPWSSRLLRWSRHVTIVHQTKDLHTTDYTQLYDFLKYNQKEVDDQRAERLAKTHDPLALMANSNNPFNYTVFHQDLPSPVTTCNNPYLS